MKKLKNSSQKSRERLAISSVRNATASGFSFVASGAGGASAGSPYGRSFTSAGRSGNRNATSGITIAAATATTSTTGRQPWRCAIAASIGRNTSWPVAVLAVRIPITRPRRAWNQRVTKVADSVSATTPVEQPTISPQITTICQLCVIIDDSATPALIVTSAVRIVGRSPKRCIAAAANGPVRPYSAMFTEIASEIAARLQPSSRSSGTISTLGVARVPAAASRIRNTTAAASHP